MAKSSRPRRVNRLARHTAPLHLFIAGGLTIVGFLFIDSVIARFALALCYAALAVLAGKRVKWLYFMIMVSSITFFHLLSPVGRVLAEIGPLVITVGALEQGLLKGAGIVGLVFASLFAVRQDLRLPGTLGGLLGKLFHYFELILEAKSRVNARHLVESLDAILLERFDAISAVGDADGRAATSATTPIGWLLMIVVVGGTWTATLLL